MIYNLFFPLLVKFCPIQGKHKKPSGNQFPFPIAQVHSFWIETFISNHVRLITYD
jgi:hypothetical protein